ncbi:MAG TPA: hypothetical protein VD887_11650 [Allosphingosinicella sp.]|nr:hypothetical protein [Allosphingosinicella sp.]
MQILAALLLMLTQAPERPAVPADWSTVPEVAYTSETGMNERVTLPVIEMERRRQCRFDETAPGTRGVSIDSLLLIGPSGELLDIVPEDHECARLESYVERLYRRHLPGHLQGPGGAAPAWYRIRTSFTWSGS